MPEIQSLLFWRGKSSANDSRHVRMPFRPDDEDNSFGNWTHGNESIFGLRMAFIINFEAVLGGEHMNRIGKAEPVLSEVVLGLSLVPFKPHVPKPLYVID